MTIFSKKDKVDKFFVSADEKFLRDWDKNNPKKSATQRAEIKKYERINRLRDDPTAFDATTKLWEKF